MYLTLTYDGPLHPVTGRDNRISEKNEIRRKLHPQLREAWLSHPALEGYLKVWDQDVGDRYQPEGNHFIVAHKIGIYSFISLVTPCPFHDLRFGYSVFTT